MIQTSEIHQPVLMFDSFEMIQGLCSNVWQFSGRSKATLNVDDTDKEICCEPGLLTYFCVYFGPHLYNPAFKQTKERKII